MTETNMITSNPYDGERRAGTVGFPLPGVSLRIAEAETGRALAHGEIGVIEVKGPNVFKGYWLMPERTAEEFRADGFFITGDLARVDERGYVQIVGRAKDPRHFRRLQRLSDRGRSGDRCARRRRRERCDRSAASRFRRRRHPRSSCRRRVLRPPRPPFSPHWRSASRATNCRNGCSSARRCRATPWARCRRRPCATNSRGPTAPEARRRSRSTKRRQALTTIGE